MELSSAFDSVARIQNRWFLAHKTKNQTTQATNPTNWRQIINQSKNLFIIIQKPKPTTMSMRQIMKLFLVLSEEDKTFDQVRPLVDQLFHNECRMQTPTGFMNKARIMADMEDIVNNKVTMELTRLEQDEFGLSYDYTMRRPREHMHHVKATAMVRDGKIYHASLTEDNENEAQQQKAVDAKRRMTTPIIHGF